MPHRALVNLAEWQLGASQERAAGRTLQYAPLSFDPSFLEMFSTWFAGGTVVLIEEALRRDFVALLRFLDRHAIERLYITPAALHQLADVAETWRIYPRALREVNAAGERLEITPAVARFFRALGDCTLFNQYGPTESHVVTASMLDERTSPWPSSPSIGCPLPNTQVYLLDGRGGSVPIGVPGELFIAGECLARGYLDKPRLTAERFVPDPSPSAKGGRLYRSGDLARRRHDGSIEFLGRTDHQVKLRGYRVEPGEIEAVLTEHRSVLHAAVAVPETAGKSRQLVAYVVARDGHHVSAEQLRAHMARRVPDYMVPSIVEQLETLPLTPSGKVDRAALPEPTGAGSGDGYLPPRTDVEHRLAALWSEILEVERVGIADNFFSIGGHSLSAVQVVSRVRREWGVEIPIRTLFECPTVSGLAERLEDLLWMARPRDRQPAGAEREEGVL
jgi:acyl-CoA synthetase (AMP-forming)/AMP-acid ligase II/acyl carrier protein